MTGSTTERRKRLLDLLETVYTRGPVSFLQLRAAAVRAWGITGRTAEEYIGVLLDALWVEHTTPGGPLKITRAGTRELGKADAKIEDAGDAPFSLARYAPPVVPSGGGQGDGIGEQTNTGVD